MKIIKKYKNINTVCQLKLRQQTATNCRHISCGNSTLHTTKKSVLYIPRTSIINI